MNRRALTAISRSPAFEGRRGRFSSPLFTTGGQGHASINPVVDVTAGIALVRHQLDTGLYSARYNWRSPGEREYVDAIVVVGDAGDSAARASSGDVAQNF